MTKKIASLFLVLLLLLGALGNCSGAEQVSGSIKLSLHPSSNHRWIAIDPEQDGNATVKVELQEAASSVWVEMMSNANWTYFQLASTEGTGFNLPLSFRLTSASGQQLLVPNAITSIGGAVLNSTQQFESNSKGHHVNAPTPAPTKKPSSHNTPAPTAAPTKKPSTQNTPAPTKKPTSLPTSSPGKATFAPTTAPSKGSSSSGSSSSTDLCAVTSTSSEPLKILVPLYVAPGAAWDQLITAAATGVSIIAIINPNSGPVSSGPDSSYKTYMQKFASAGIEMVGYVHTSYGARALSDVEADVATYASKYTGLVGIFVDETSADASEVSYYTSLFSSIKSHSGYVNTILNPGTQPDEGYLNAGTNIMIFESPGSSFKSNFASWVKCASSSATKSNYKYKFSAIAYGVSQSTMPTTLSEMEAAGIGMVYVTDGASGCCTYNSLTSYFPQLAASVKALN